MRDNLMTLTSEERNPASVNLPHMSVAESTALMNREDQACTKAVREVLPEVNETIEQCIAALRRGGRIIFTGAAHSGYLGMLDAYEANATFGTHGEVVSIVAGNFTDIMKTDGSAEDSAENGALDLQAREVTAKDFVIGISSSGRTPYVIGALSWCQKQGIPCAGLVNNKHSLVSEVCDRVMAPVPGPEVITGSTRLKAGTCQKMILNMITTVTMAQLGNVYENLMINVPPVSDKMRTRLAYILTQATSCTLDRARQLLTECEYQIKPALIMELKHVSREEAQTQLNAAGGNLNQIL